MEAVVAAVAGLALGQIVDLLWGRFYTGEEIRQAIYRCAACRYPIDRPVLLLPFAAAIVWDEGQCPRCGEALSNRSILLPGATAILFLISYWAFGGHLGAALLGGVFATMFLVLAMTDMETRLLPNRIVYPGIILALAVSWVWPETTVLEVFGGGLFAVVIAAMMLGLSQFFGPDAIGMGDIKMIVLMGFATGWPAVVVGVFVGIIAGGIFAALLLLGRQASRRDYMAHGPFLALGGLVALFFGNDIWDAYTG